VQPGFPQGAQEVYTHTASKFTFVYEDQQEPKCPGDIEKAVPEGFPQLVHGLGGIAIEQRPHALPQQALAPQFGPDRSEYGTAQLLGLVHQKREHHDCGKHNRQVLLAMAVVVLKVIALIFQRIERLIFYLPPL
jgi:hypothetical protein